MTSDRGEVIKEKTIIKTNQMGIKTHKDLDVYQDAMDFVVSIYRVTKSFPTEERYGLTSQMPAL